MLRKRNRRKEGWEKSDRTERTSTCMGGEMGEDKERRDRGGNCTSDMQKKRWQLREGREKKEIHRIFQERGRQKSRTRMTGGRRGLNRGSVYLLSYV